MLGIKLGAPPRPPPSGQGTNLCNVTGSPGVQWFRQKKGRRVGSRRGSRAGLSPSGWTSLMSTLPHKGELWAWPELGPALLSGCALLAIWRKLNATFPGLMGAVVSFLRFILI